MFPRKVCAALMHSTVYCIRRLVTYGAQPLVCWLRNFHGKEKACPEATPSDRRVKTAYSLALTQVQKSRQWKILMCVSVCERVCVCECACVSVWVSLSVCECVCVCDCACVSVSECERVREVVNFVRECVCDCVVWVWVSVSLCVSMCEWACVCVWVSVCVCECVWECVSEWVCVSVCECVHERVCVSVWVCVCDCVSVCVRNIQFSDSSER